MTTKIYDLSQPVWNGSVMWPRLVTDVQIRARSFGGIRSTGWQGLNHPGWFDFGQPFPFVGPTPGGAIGQWVGHLHGGTHVDAPKYCIPEGITADKIPLENLYGTGVIIDMRHKGKWDTITSEDFEKATPKIEAGDFVVVNTGWQKWLKPDKGYEYYHYYPGLLPSAAEWLIKKKVKAISGTWPTCDHSLSFAPLEPLGKYMPNLYHDYLRETGKEPGPEFSYGFEGCLTMLLKNGVSCIQNAGGDIDEVTGIRCTLCAWPFRLEDTDGAMVRLVALIEE
jgi:kynurenine formamidase